MNTVGLNLPPIVWEAQKQHEHIFGLARGAGRECVRPPLAQLMIMQEINQSQQKLPQSLPSFHQGPIKPQKKKKEIQQPLNSLGNPSCSWKFHFFLNFSLSCIDFLFF